MEEIINQASMYILYIAEMRIDGEGGFPPLFAYGGNEEEAKQNMQPIYNSEDWKRIELISITPRADGFQLSKHIHLEGRINEDFYRAYVSTIPRLELPLLENDSETSLTTTLHIFADILQRLINAKAIVEVSTNIEEDGFIDEDENGNEVVVEAGPAEIVAVIEEKIEVDETNLSLIADDWLRVDDIDEDYFIVTHSFWKTNTRLFCELLTELADAGHLVQAKIQEEDVRILEIEYLDTGKVQALYVPFKDNAELNTGVPYYVANDFLSRHVDIIVVYNEEEARDRLYSPH
ncbi:MAG TPA: hypothetical protein VFV38_50015 [Ktedonobacteraceae bacterium]|nr:hypothetical protein [Ktedonobacteraceae bacterium]